MDILNRCLLMAAMILVGLTASPVSAQAPGGRRGGPWSKLDLDRMFVGYRSIQEELELTESQLELLDALDTDLDAQSRSSFRRRRRPQGRAAQVEVTATVFQSLLEPKQVERLAEINLQFRGLDAINDESFEKEVALTDEQLAAIRKVGKEKPAFDMSKLHEVVGLTKAKKWWTTLGYPFVFSEDLQDLRYRYRERQQAGRFRRRRP